MLAMMLPIRAVLLAVLATSLLYNNARAQAPDEATLPPSEADAIDEPIDAMPADSEEPAPLIVRRAEITREAPRENEIVLEPSGATRREILNRLFADRQVEIEWRNNALADEKVRGRLKGGPTELARRLLERGNYVMAYGSSGDLARIVVLGSDPPSVTRSADAPSSVRQKPQASEADRRRQAIEATRRAIKDAQQRR
jgi:hypothetical protein